MFSTAMMARSAGDSGESARHTHPHINPGIDACGNRTLGITERTVQQCFVFTDMNAEWWHPGKLTWQGEANGCFASALSR
jgi:hypothetical protein